MRNSKYIDGWDRLTLNRYELMLGVDPESEDANLEIMGVANGLSLNEVMNLPIQEATAMAEAFRFTRNAPKVRRTKKAYTVNGREYAPMAEPGKITTAQYIDYDQLENKKDLTSVLAIVMVPPGHIYNDGYDFEQAKADIGSLTVEEAVSICDFFTRALGLYALHATRLARKALRRARKDGVDVKEAMKETKRLGKAYALRCLLG